MELSFILVRSRFKATLAYLYKHLIIRVKCGDSHNANLNGYEY
ncbi:hypothetical protein MCW_00993 [Cardidatus Bartonella washoeensis 085-0475]|uniref:Uncharacterized protein n=1 Tax=Cardidatus Bartonella washoeensis 085-0475 TaxID=1094564 RepID=J1JKA4_9HYPH|nr:hypothetical protein MCW_00993 [Bartonella washoeensis 085-0475]